MYVVKINNGAGNITIHGETQNLSSGNVVKGINTIDSFSFSMLPSNAGFDKIYDLTTCVSVYNTNKKRYEFYGRVLYSDTSMSESGLITLDVVCESYLGFLCDSQQEYVEARNWTVLELLEHIVDTHNALVEDYKRFTVGEVTVTDPNDNLYVGIQRENTWDTLNEKLIETLGGEIRFRVDGDTIYLDYLESIGEHSSTKIAVSRNMKSIKKEKDSTEIVTRLIPLGCKLTTEETKEDGTKEEVETEYRLDITSVNDGKKYIDDEAAQAQYGIKVKTVEFDNITVASTLLKRGEEWLQENNRVKIKYSASALDLSLLGLDIDDYDVHNYYDLKNPLVGVNDNVRIIKKNIDICDDIKSTIELGEKFEALSDLQKKQSNALKLITSEYVTNKRFTATIDKTTTLIKQTEETIRLDVTGEYSNLDKRVAAIELNIDDIILSLDYISENYSTRAELALKIGRDEDDQIVSMLNASADIIELKSNRLVIDSDNFKLTADGTITANAGFVGDCEIVNGELTVKRLFSESANADFNLSVDSARIFMTQSTFGLNCQLNAANLVFSGDFLGQNSSLTSQITSQHILLKNDTAVLGGIVSDAANNCVTASGIWRFSAPPRFNQIYMGDTVLTETQLQQLLALI